MGPLALTGRILQIIVRYCCARPVVTVAVALAAAGAGAGYAAHSLTLETSKFHLLPLHKPYATLYKDYAEDFGQLEDIVVVVESPAVDTSTAYAARLAGILRAGALGTARVSYRIDASRLEAHALLYLPLDTLRATLETIAGQEDLLADFAAAPTLDRLVDGINQHIGATSLPGAFGDDGPADASPAAGRLLRTLVTQMSERLDGGPNRSPWTNLIGAPTLAPDGGYFLSHDRRLLFVVIDLAAAPRTFAAEQAAILAVRHAIIGLRQEFPSVEAGVTGAPALFSDEMSAATRDGEIASVLALVLSLGLLVLAFRHLLTSCAMLVVLTLSLGWSLGVITLLVGHLTILSMMFISVVVGLGTDYGTFFLFRYREERVLGRTLLGALERTAARSGPGILLGALTAAVTFFIVMTAEFQGIRDFGLVSGTAILLSFASMVTVFPAAVVLIERWRSARHAGAVTPPPQMNGGRRQVPALEWLTRHPKTIVLTAVVATGASLWAAPRLAFDYNLLNLQASGTESVVWEKKAAAAAGRSVFAALSTAPSLPELETKQAAFARLPSVSDVQSVLSVLPDGQAEKLAILERLASVTDSIRLGAPRPLDLKALTVALETLKRRMDMVSTQSGSEHAPEGVLIMVQATAALLARLQGRERGGVEAALADYQAHLAADFAQQWRRLQVAAHPAPFTLGDLPDEVRRRFIGKSGRLLLQVYSRHDPWDYPSQTRFVEELRGVDPDVTGQPIVGYESTRIIASSFRRGLLYAFALVTGIAALMIRRVRETALAVVPLVLGTLWTVGVMQLAGLKLNLVNVWAFPLIVGSAAEYGLYIVLQSLEDGGRSRLARSTVMAVMFNGLTTITGFGSLLVAHHRGVRSLGLLLVIGSVTTLTASLVVLPTLLGLRRGHRQTAAAARVPEFAQVGRQVQADGAAAALVPGSERVSDAVRARHSRR